MASYGVQIEGLGRLNRSLNKINKDAGKTVRTALKEAAEPVRERAESLASSKITNIGGTWPRMRVGATSKTVYVAPKTRNRGGSPRPNLGRLLFDQAMQPALEQKKDEVIHEVEEAFERLGNSAGF